MTNDAAARSGIAEYVLSNGGSHFDDEQMERLIDDAMFQIDDLVTEYRRAASS